MIKKLLPAIAALAIIAVNQSCKSCHPEVAVSDIHPDSLCANAPASWFANATTAAPDDYGPFVDTSTTTDCDFHLWSFQKFLSLTRSANGKAPFENLVQVSNDLELLGGVLNLTDITQAGTHGTLYDSTSNPVYYSIFVNQRMYDFQNMYLPKFAGHIDSLQTYGLDTLSYPVGCFEVKASWILASSLSSTALQKYYTTTANFSNAPDVEPVLRKVALLGMHIVGKVDNHPDWFGLLLSMIHWRLITTGQPEKILSLKC